MSHKYGLPLSPSDHGGPVVRSSRSTAIVTGASGGIGAPVVGMLLASGYRVVALSRSAPPISDSNLVHLPCDMADSDSLNRACDTILRDHGSVQVLVHGAGVIAPSEVEGMAMCEATRQISVNLTAPVVLTSRILPVISRSGRIVFINSMAAAMPLAGSSVYAATKAGLRNFAFSLAQETRTRGIAVSSLFPGAVDTAMLRSEMACGGSILNFVSRPVAPEVVAREVVRLIERPKAERFLPAIDGVFGRLCMLAPGLLRISLPLLMFFGRRGYSKAVRDGRADGRHTDAAAGRTPGQQGTTGLSG